MLVASAVTLATVVPVVPVVRPVVPQASLVPTLSVVLQERRASVVTEAPVVPATPASTA